MTMPTAASAVPQTSSKSAPQRLDMQLIFSWLLADGIVAKDDVKKLYTQAQVIHKNAPAAMHPLVAVAQCKITIAQAPHRLMTLDWLTEWLAAKVKLPFFRIDPLKIDFTRVADVMSASYAARFHILPVELTPSELVVATSDPFNVEWEPEIAKVSRRNVKRVIASPLDIDQYTTQFFTLAKSIKSAKKMNGQDVALRNNFEQLVELGNHKQVDANDQHIVNIVDWLWQYAFEQRDIRHSPGTETRILRDPLPHRRRAASGVSGAGGGDDCDDRAHQAAGPHGRHREAPPAGWPHQDAHQQRTGNRVPAGI
jgi:general secretion pathway protein E